ncbi:GAF domain-containing sensor histidine kinase [Amycolatopsis pithecellobii]|uniref:histidine kinase n=1 Tax=Amycolatopsis pithecellobii TaxID=664692 RepID=A0A6N7Z737_9PSEU|nr:GAF domain-containing sensor histidine kinase [Amycolatopsis pithecellobii]MTD55576.1 GAF domain-containing protein [Amycolatopsis pithecellobii]
MAPSPRPDRDHLAQLLREQEALRRVATLVAHGEPTETVFAAVVEETGKVLGADAARMLRREPDDTCLVIAAWGGTQLRLQVGAKASTNTRNIATTVVRTGKTTWSDAVSGPDHALGQIALEDGVQLGVAAPIFIEGRVWGVMLAIWMHAGPHRAESEARLAQFTDLVAAAVSNTQAREDLAASRARLMTASDQTRRRIERDLHDGTQQRLVSLALDVRSLQAEVPDELPDLQQQLSEIAEGLAGALDDLREIARGIHPAILSEGGLSPALNALARRSAVPVEIDVHILARLPAAIEVAAYYLAAEVLTNAAKHAEASAVRIEAAQADNRLTISISDNGVGGADADRGSGLIGLIDRIEALGGRITITSRPGHGTQVCAELPTDTG